MGTVCGGHQAAPTGRTPRTGDAARADRGVLRHAAIIWRTTGLMVIVMFSMLVPVRAALDEAVHFAEFFDLEQLAGPVEIGNCHLPSGIALSPWRVVSLSSEPLLGGTFRAEPQ